MFGKVLPRPWLFRVALHGAILARPFARSLPRRLAPMMALAPATVPRSSATDRRACFPGPRREADAGSAIAWLRPARAEGRNQRGDNSAADPPWLRGCRGRGRSGCCGSLNHHLGQEVPALALARANIDAWERERLAGGLDAIVVNASGCGTTVKGTGFMLREDPAYAEKAARIAALARDVTEIVEQLVLRPPTAENSAHGLQVASLGMLAAARSAAASWSEVAAERGRVRDRRGAGGAYLLRFSRDL